LPANIISLPLAKPASVQRPLQPCPPPVDVEPDVLVDVVVEALFEPVALWLEVPPPEPPAPVSSPQAKIDVASAASERTRIGCAA
jgi:hypothetical protein